MTRHYASGGEVLVVVVVAPRDASDCDRTRLCAGSGANALPFNIVPSLSA